MTQTIPSKLPEFKDPHLPTFICRSCGGIAKICCPNGYWHCYKCYYEGFHDQLKEIQEIYGLISQATSKMKLFQETHRMTDIHTKIEHLTHILQETEQEGKSVFYAIQDIVLKEHPLLISKVRK